MPCIIQEFISNILTSPRDVVFPPGHERHMAATLLITNLVETGEARTSPDAIGIRYEHLYIMCQGVKIYIISHFIF